MLPIFNSYSNNRALHPFSRLSAFDSLFDEWRHTFDRLRSFDPFEATSAQVSETSDCMMINLPLNGINPDNCEVSIENGTLTIKGSSQEVGKDGDRYQRSFSSVFSQTMSLPSNIIEGQAKASVENGLLTVVIPKIPTNAEASKAIEVPVNIKSLDSGAKAIESGKAQKA